MTVKWGVIGAGGIADRRTIPEMLKIAKNSELVAVMDLDFEKTKALAKKYGAQYYYDKEEELLKNKEVEAVYIGTPQHLHHKQVLLAAQYGKHIFCEKPIAISTKECEEMIEVCKKKKVKLMVGFTMRLNVYNQKAKELISQGALGKLVMGRAQLTCWYPPIPGAWRQDISISQGGSLIDMGSHCIDLLEVLINSKVIEVSAFQNKLIHNYPTPIEDTSTVILRFENRAHGIVDNYFDIPDAAAKGLLEVYGTKGSILAQGTIGQEPTGKMTSYLKTKEKGYEATQTRGEEVEVKEYNLTPVEIYGAGIKHFADCIIENKKPLITGEDALRNLKIILAAYESAKTGKVVKV